MRMRERNSCERKSVMITTTLGSRTYVDSCFLICSATSLGRATARLDIADKRYGDLSIGPDRAPDG